MAFRLSLLAASLAAGITIMALPGSAASINGAVTLKELGAAQSSGVEEAAFLRGRCWWGIGGWHKYVRGVGRVQCTTRKCWRNSWGVRRCRWY